MNRAIVRDPDACLFDEPLPNLDAALRVEIGLEIAKLHRRIKATTVYVTYDQVAATTLADRIVVMNEGNMEKVGAPLDLYHRPETLFVATFIGGPTMNTLDCDVVAGGNGRIRLRLPAGEVDIPLADAPRSLERATPSLRSEDLAVCAAEAAWFTGELSVVERLGGQTFGYVDIGRDRMIAVEFHRTSTVHLGERIPVAGRGEQITFSGRPLAAASTDTGGLGQRPLASRADGLGR